MTVPAVEYAREVWAACSTLGFNSDDTRKLKAALDDLPTAPAAGDLEALVALVRDVQQGCVTWASKRGLPG